MSLKTQAGRQLLRPIVPTTWQPSTTSRPTFTSPPRPSSKPQCQSSMHRPVHATQCPRFYTTQERVYSRTQRSAYGTSSSDPSSKAAHSSTSKTSTTHKTSNTIPGPARSQVFRQEGGSLKPSRSLPENLHFQGPRGSKKGAPRDLDAGRLVAKEKRALFLPKQPETWQVQKKALTKKFQNGWNPRKKLSPDAVEGIRGLHAQDKEKYSTEALSEHFKVSPEAIRRILRSKWRPKDEKAMEERRQRWAKRHDKIWDFKSQLGLRPERTEDRRLEGPEEFEQNLKAEEMLKNARQD